MSNLIHARILIADDQPNIRKALALLLKGEDFETTAVAPHNGIRRAADVLTALMRKMVVLANVPCFSRIGSGRRGCRRGGNMATPAAKQSRRCDIFGVH